MYTVDDLIADFRSDVYDREDVDAAGNPRDTLWSPADVLRYANFAQSQWAVDTLYVRRNLTLAVTAGKASYYTGADLIEVVRATFATSPSERGRKLAVFNLGDGALEDDYGTLFYTDLDLEHRQGVPRGVTLDHTPNCVRLYPIPATDGFLSLNITIYPPQLQLGMPLPSQNTRDIYLLLLWMKHLAYRKQDADVLDLSRADAYRNEYQNEMIERKYELDRERRNGGVITPRSF